MLYGSWNVSTTGIIFCHSGPFSAFLPPYGLRKPKSFYKIGKNTWRYHNLKKKVNDSYMMYGSADMECTRQTFFVILDHFLPFYPLTTQKIKIWKNAKATWRYITLQMSAINENHMMYGSWDMEHMVDRMFCHLGPFFALLPH